MGIFDQAMQCDSQFTANTDELSESFVYTRADTSTTTVKGIIDRNPPSRDDEFSTNTRNFEVWIPYNDTDGLTAKPDEGDSIAVKDDPADTATTNKYLYRVLNTDAGGWLCEFV